HAAVEVPELAREARAVELRGADGVRGRVALAPAVERRVLLEPRRRERQRPDRVGEEERDLLPVLVRREELDPGAVPAGAVLQADRAADRAAVVPPIAADH